MKYGAIIYAENKVQKKETTYINIKWIPYSKTEKRQKTDNTINRNT